MELRNYTKEEIETLVQRIYENQHEMLNKESEFYVLDDLPCDEEGNPIVDTIAFTVSFLTAFKNLTEDLMECNQGEDIYDFIAAITKHSIFMRDRYIQKNSKEEDDENHE